MKRMPPMGLPIGKGAECGLTTGGALRSNAFLAFSLTVRETNKGKCLIL